MRTEPMRDTEGCHYDGDDGDDDEDDNDDRDDKQIERSVSHPLFSI